MKDLENLSLKELKLMVSASKNLKGKIAGYSKMKQPELLDAIKRAKAGEIIKARKKTASAWTNALKEFNKGKQNWSIPKKGTADYDAVKAIMNGSTPSREIVESTSKPMKQKRSKVVPTEVVVESVPVVVEKPRTRSKSKVVKS